MSEKLAVYRNVTQEEADEVLEVTPVLLYKDGTLVIDIEEMPEVEAVLYNPKKQLFLLV